MSTLQLISACPACGAEEALDSLLLRMVDDDQVRRLIADVITRSLPVGGLVVRYLRLHKPAKQQLRMSRVRGVLAELVPDIVRGAITRKGREWAAPMEAWRTALESVFESHQKGTLTLPLDGNAYLYEILLRQADRVEAQAEKEREALTRSRPHGGAPASLADVIGDMDRALGRASEAVDALARTGRPPVQPGTSPTVRRMRAEREAALARRALDTTSNTQPSETP